MDKWEYQDKPCYLENHVVREPCKQRTACIRFAWNQSIFYQFKWLCWEVFFQVFIWLGMYNFGCGFKIIALHASQEVIPSPRVQKLFSKTAWFQLAHQRGENWGQVPCYKAERAAFKRLLNNFVAVGRLREVSQLGLKGFEVAFEYFNSHGQLFLHITPIMKTILSMYILNIWFEK